MGTEDEAQKVVEEAKKYFTEQDVKNGAEIVNVAVKDDIKIVGKIVDNSKVVDAQTAVNALLGNRSNTSQYQVKKRPCDPYNRKGHKRY